MKEKETGHADSQASDSIIYKFDVPANRCVIFDGTCSCFILSGSYFFDLRYDLLCLEGVTRAFSIFHEKEKMPEYMLTKPKQLQRMIVKKEVKEIRAYVFCAILRGIHFNEKNYQSFIDLQEKLHQNICRYDSVWY